MTNIELTTDQLDSLLDTEFECFDLNKLITVRGYLWTLLRDLWRKEESFNGKRPFGNSGWQWDVYYVLIVAEVIDGEIDEDDGITDIDEKAGEAVVLKLIDRMCGVQEAQP